MEIATERYREMREIAEKLMHSSEEEKFEIVGILNAQDLRDLIHVQRLENNARWERKWGISQD